MPKVSKDSTTSIDQGGAGTEWRGDLRNPFRESPQVADVARDGTLNPLVGGRIPGAAETAGRARISVQCP
jgi:hypothetical protein